VQLRASRVPWDVVLLIRRKRFVKYAYQAFIKISLGSRFVSHVILVRLHPRLAVSLVVYALLEGRRILPNLLRAGIVLVAFIKTVLDSQIALYVTLASTVIEQVPRYVHRAQMDVPRLLADPQHVLIVP